MEKIDNAQNKISLDYKNIFEYAEDDMSYLFVDKIDIFPGIEAYGIKLASMQDWYFKIHFPGNPMMPGVFIMESIITTGTFVIFTMPDKKGTTALFDGCKDVKIFRSVRPGDILKTHAVMESYKYGIAKFYGEAFVEEKIVCKMHFNLTVPEDIILSVGGKNAH